MYANIKLFEIHCHFTVVAKVIFFLSIHLNVENQINYVEVKHRFNN